MLFNSDGSIHWEKTTGTGMPTIGPFGDIYVIYAGWLRAINSRTGEMDWTFETNDPEPARFFTTSPPALAIDGRTIYVVDHKATLFAVRLNGSQAWRRDSLDSDHVSTFMHPVVTPSGEVLIGTLRGEGLDPKGYVKCYSPTGQLLWKHALPIGADRAPAVASDGSIYLNGISETLALTRGGQLLWQKDWESGVDANPIIGGGGTIYFTRQGGLWAFNPDGSLKWLFNDAGGSGPIMIGPDGVIYIGGLIAVGDGSGPPPQPQPVTTLYFPHYGDGNGLAMLFSISNFGSSPVVGTLRFYDELGELKVIPTASGNMSEVPLGLDSNSTTVIKTLGISDPLAVGYAVAELDQAEVSGVAIFQFESGVEASVLPSQIGKKFAVFAERSGSLNTGLAVASTTGGASIQMRLHGLSGEVLADSSWNLTEGQKYDAFFLTEIPLVNDLGEFQGVLVMESPEPFSLVGLRFSVTGVLTTILVVRLDSGQVAIN